MANTPDKPQMTEEERADLMAMIAAGRDLSPEMDKSLVESYAERRAAQEQARAKLHGNQNAQSGQGNKSNAVVPQRQPSEQALLGANIAMGVIGTLMMAGIFVAVMLFTGGHGWWVIFPLFFLFGGWGGRYGRHRLRDERRTQRYQMRADHYRTRMGYPPRDEARRLPASSESDARDSGPLPPPIGVPAQTPPATRTTPSAGAQSSTGDQPPTNPAG